MIRTFYNKNQYFFNLLAFNLFWNIIRIVQWHEVQPDKLPFILKYITVEFFIVLVFCEVMIGIDRFTSKWKNAFIHLANFVILPIVFSALLFLLAYYVKRAIWPEGILYGLSFNAVKSASYFYIMFFVMLVGIVYLTRFRLNFLQQKDATYKAETLAKDTQLKMLRYQINPHFLFNILNSLHALINENKDIAKKLIIDFSEYYRSTLDKNLQEHTIESEINIIRKYLEIQKTRFEDNFDYEISADQTVLLMKIPAFIIHLLIENAVKYGIKCFEDKLMIRLHIKKTGNQLSIEAINSGKINDPQKVNELVTPGIGSGIDNIIKRLKLYYGDNFNFSLNEENNWVIARITINTGKE